MKANLHNIVIKAPTSSKVCTYGVLVIAAVILVTLFSTSSPIYPLNPWDDSNIFMTIGRSILHGKLLYRDVFDQKGPMIFYIHTLAAWIDEGSFFGIYLLQILSMFAYLVFSYKIMRLFSIESITMPLTITMALLMMTSDFYFYGDSVEEFCLPALTFSLYLILKYIKTGDVPPIWRVLVFGMSIGLILWTKFTILVFYAGALVSLSVWAYKNNRVRELLKIILWAIAGIVLVTAIVVGVFYVQGNLKDMLNAYWYENLFNYNNSSNNGEPTVWWFILVKIGMCIGVTSPLLFLHVKRSIKWIVASCFFMQCLSFTLFTVQIYYFLVVYAFAPLVICFFRGGTHRKLKYSILSVAVILALMSSYNLILLISGTFPNKVIGAAKIINEDGSKNKDVVIYSSHETGIYMLTGQLPLARYFFVPNLEIPALIKEQKTLAKSPKVKYLIQKTDNVTHGKLYYDFPVPENYEKVFDGEEKYRYLFLIHTKMYFWNLGYTQCVLKHIMQPDDFKQHIVLYRKKQP